MNYECKWYVTFRLVHLMAGLRPSVSHFKIKNFFCLLRASPVAYEDSQARGLIGAIATGLFQSHSNAGSKPHLQPTPELTAMLDP